MPPGREIILMTCLCAEATLGGTWLVLEQVYLTRHRHSDAYVPHRLSSALRGARDSGRR